MLTPDNCVVALIDLQPQMRVDCSDDDSDVEAHWAGAAYVNPAGHSGESSAFYAALAILLLGPGRYSIDAKIKVGLN
ncbi:MAG: hypothetical protein HYX27_01725 [Acidobacteria bacterium]|nr:hypothetical protein [Acidobacteriota bacterium]